MKKVQQQLPTGEWDNLVTKYAPDDSRFVSVNAFTNGTKNIETDTDGTIRKIKGGVQFATLSTVPQDQYEAIFSDGTRHLLVVDDGDLSFSPGTATFTSVTTGYSTGANFEFATTQDRVYFGNGVNANQVYDRTTSYGGVGYSAPQTKDMGAQIPGSAPTLDSQTTASSGGVPVGDHTYKVTFLYYDFEESNGSTSSAVINVSGASDNEVILNIPTGGYGVTDRKIYRDDNDGNYILIDTISDNTTTTYNDTSLSGTTPIPTDNGIPPRAGQIKLYLDRLWFAQVSGEPYTLYFSEVGFPDIVESTNFIDCDQEDPITALTVYRGRLVVFNRRSMGQILGDTRDTFRYDPIQGSVGCVDNRSIQEIVLNGVPTLIWLSDKGFYGFNGSSIVYLSDSIENLVNSDIQQAVIQRNEQVDTTTANFNGGTVPDGMNTAGGQLTANGYADGGPAIGDNPRRTWEDTADWDGGSDLDNIATIGLSNTMQTVTDFEPDITTDGTRENLEIDGTTLRPPIASDFTGEVSSSTAGTNTQVSAGEKLIRGFYQRIIPTRSGTITEIRVSGRPGTSGTVVEAGVVAESGGLPDKGSIIGSIGSTLAEPPHPTSGLFSITVNAEVTAGTPYWIFENVADVSWDIGSNLPYVPSGSVLSGGDSVMDSNDTTFIPVTNVFSGNEFHPAMEYDITADPVAQSGQWKSSVYDTQSNSANPSGLSVDIDNTNSNFGMQFLVQAGDELDISSNLIVESTETFTAANATGTFTFIPTAEDYRYWQITATFTSQDDRLDGPTLNSAEFDFNTDGVWISESIDTTSDSTTYNNLTTVVTTPTGTSVTTEIRTADTEGGLTAAPWVAFGSVTVRKWAQVRLTLSKNVAGTSTPTVNSVELDWTIVSEFISESIDTGVTPSGWDIFQTNFDTNGGTAVFQMRSAATEGGLSGATWNTVTNGNFPPAALDTEQWVQWRVTTTTTDGNVPVVRSVTIRWFIGDFDPATRAASIFHDKGYYVALAEFGSNENNIILKLDERGKWRLIRGLGVNTFSFFFNEPYFGSSTSAVVGKFLQSLQHLGTDIEVDVRTKNFDFSNGLFDNSQFTKVLESVMIEGRGTGATYDVSYSLDGGETFTSLIDITTGSTTYATTNDDQVFQRVFRVDHSDGNIVGNQNIMLRVHTNDEFDVKLHRLKATAFITRQEPIITG